ncbi:MAG: hypothetical protein ABI651_09680, partial [Verrucomicrobiota bacterium]
MSAKDSSSARFWTAATESSELPLSMGQRRSVGESGDLSDYVPALQRHRPRLGLRRHDGTTPLFLHAPP